MSEALADPSNKILGSDLGPAREGPSEEQIKEALAKRAAQLGNAPPTAYGVNKKKEEDEAEDAERFANAENEEGLFATGNYDRDDDEADRIYQDVDERMDRRRKARRLVCPISWTALVARTSRCSVHRHSLSSEHMPTFLPP